MNRRELLKAAAALPLAQAALSNPAHAQAAWPARNITMIVPFPAGGQADLAARPVALALERILGRSVIVDNRAGGAGGSIGNAQAARAEADGYTLLMTLSSLAVLPEADRLFDRPVAYEVSQFAPVARVLADPTLLAVPAAAPWKTLQDFADPPAFRGVGLKDVEFYIWAGLFAQSALPAPIMTRLREAMALAVKSPEVTKTFETAGSPVAYMDVPEFSKFVAEDSARLIAAVKKIGKVE